MVAAKPSTSRSATKWPTIDTPYRPISDVGNLACDRLQCSNELSFADRQPYILSLGSRVTSCDRVLRAHDAIHARNAAKQSNVSTSIGRLLVRPSMTVCEGDQRCGADAGIEPSRAGSGSQGTTTIRIPRADAIVRYPLRRFFPLCSAVLKIESASRVPVEASFASTRSCSEQETISVFFG